MLLSEIYRAWLREKHLHVRPSTLAAYTYIMEHHLLPHFADSEGITSTVLQQYVNTMHAQGMRRNSLNNILSVMRMVLRFGEEQGWCSVPEGKLRLPPNTPTGKLQVMSVREEEKFVRFLLGKDSPLDVALLTGMTTGMRLGELCGLQAGDLLLERQLCQVNRTVSVTYDREARRTYLSVNLPAGNYALNGTGSAYELTADVTTVSPFRPYFTAGTTPLKAPKAIVFSDEDSTLQGDPEQETVDSGLAAGGVEISVDGRDVVVTSTLSQPADGAVFDAVGRQLAAFTVQPDGTVRTTVNASGAYIVNVANGRFTKKLIVK